MEDKTAEITAKDPLLYQLTCLQGLHWLCGHLTLHCFCSLILFPFMYLDTDLKSQVKHPRSQTLLRLPGERERDHLPSLEEVSPAPEQDPYHGTGA